MATDAKQQELLTPWEDEHYCKPREGGMFEIGWGLIWFSDRDEVERMVGVLQAALFSGEEAAPDFEAFLGRYPHKNSGRRHKKESRLAWEAMSDEERRLIAVAVDAYAKHVGSTGEFPPHCFRWMGFEFIRSSGKVRRQKGEAPWKEWVPDENAEAAPAPRQGPYRLWKPPDECTKPNGLDCGGCGFVYVVGAPGPVRCLCAIGENMSQGILQFRVGKDVVA